MDVMLHSVIRHPITCSGNLTQQKVALFRCLAHVPIATTLYPSVQQVFHITHPVIPLANLCLRLVLLAIYALQCWQR